MELAVRGFVHVGVQFIGGGGYEESFLAECGVEPETDRIGEVVTMGDTGRTGMVIFTGNKDRLARFYEAVTGMAITAADGDVTVLASDAFELVIHALRGEPVRQSALPRREAYVKPFFRVATLAETRQRARDFGGRMSPPAEEWQARGFRACEAVDPDGNPIQFRETPRIRSDEP